MLSASQSLWVGALAPKKIDAAKRHTFRGAFPANLSVFLTSGESSFGDLYFEVTVLAPPAFVMTNLYCPSAVGVTLTEHFGPGESSLATSAPEES